MRLSVGDLAPSIELNAIDGLSFASHSYAGKPYLISFYRFSSCPFCNLRLHELLSRQSELGGDFELLAVFDATLDDLKRDTGKHHAPFPILADEHRTYYKSYGIEFSWRGMFRGLIFRFPTLLKGMLKGYLPINMFKRGLVTMPADFLVDEKGIIRTAYYGSDEGDHLSFEQIQAFAKNHE